MKKNICFSISDLEKSGGTQRILTFLCNLLVDKYNIFILVNSCGTVFFPLNNKVNIIQIPQLPRKQILRRNFEVYKLLKKNNIDYYINLDSNSIIFNSILLPRKTKLILWEHFSLSSNFKKLHFTISRHYAAIRCKNFVLISKTEISDWNKFNPLAGLKSTLIYNPLTIDADHIDKSNKYEEKYFLAIGNNIQVKGFDILLKACKNTKTDRILRIVGLDNHSITQLHEIIKKDNISNIELYGKEKDITKFYKSSSLFLLPSRKEATPLVLIESQAYGIPAIVFDHLPSVLELIDESAIVVAYDESGNSFKKAIENVIGDNVLYSTLHSNAVKNSLRFSKTQFKEKWMKLLS